MIEKTFDFRMGGGFLTHALEQIVDQRDQQGHIFSDKFAQVHITQSSLKQKVFLLVGVRATHSTSSTQHRQNVSETEIVVRLLGELFFAQLVQHVELLAETIVLEETSSSELHLNNDETIGDHHRHTTEEHFEIFGQLQ